MIMGITDRQAQIAEMLQQKDFLNVEELAEYFQVTTRTIRRDLNAFCDRGIVHTAMAVLSGMRASGTIRTLGDRAEQMVLNEQY